MSYWPHSARFAAALRAGQQQVCTKLGVLSDGDEVVTLEGTVDVGGADVGLVGGSVSSSRSVVRRQSTVTILDASGVLTPRSAADLLAPLRAEFRPYRGLVFPDATPAERAAGDDREYVPMGTFVVTGISIDWPQITVSGYDRMWLIGKARFTSVYSIAAGTLTTTALARLLTSRMPYGRAPVAVPAGPWKTGNVVYDEQADPAEAAWSLATAAGLLIAADQLGVFTASPEPEPSAAAAVWSYAPGPRSISMRPTRELDASDVYNAVVATGEAADTGTGDDPDAVVVPVRGYAQDNDPLSLTYVGALGVVIPFFYSSPLLQSPAQANLAAATVLRSHLGLSDTVGVPSVPNPALDVADVVTVVDEETGINGAYLVDSVTTPLRASDGVQQITCRRTSLFGAGVS